MKDTLRTPDGKIRTACKFCRQRKKRCSGEMPCASCVNFNRDCCVYDRWSSTPTSATRAKEMSTLNRLALWSTESRSTTAFVSPTAPCFTSRVVLKRVQSQESDNSSVSSTSASSSSAMLQPPFTPCGPGHNHSHHQQHSSTSSSRSLSPDSQVSDLPHLSLSVNTDGGLGSPYSACSTIGTPRTPADAMMRTISLPSFDSQGNYYEDSSAQAQLFAPNKASMTPSDPFISMNTGSATMARTYSTPSFPWSKNEIHYPPVSPVSEDFTSMLSSPWYPSSGDMMAYQSPTLDQSAGTQQLLQNVDALLLQLETSATA